MVEEFRQRVPFIENDTVMYPYINEAIDFLACEPV